MTTYFVIVFELLDDTQFFKDRLREILERNFENIKNLSKTNSLKIYMKEGKKLVIE